MPRKRFALIGDSLTQQSFDVGGWGARLTSLYQRKADIRLRGYSGYNTRWALQTLDDNFPANGPSYDLATIWYGANDAALPDRHNARQHVPVKEYKQNLSQFVERMLQLRAKVIVFTPPPVDDAARKRLATTEEGISPPEALPERTLEAAEQYAIAAREVANSRGVFCLDLWTKLQELPSWQDLLSDGLHFNQDGNEAVYNILLAYLNENLPQFRAEKMTPDYPWHTDIDSKDFKASFAAHTTQKSS